MTTTLRRELQRLVTEACDKTYCDDIPRQAPTRKAWPSGQVRDGYVRVERTSYHYGRQGQTSVAHHDIRDVRESELGGWLYGQHIYVTFSDGAMEIYDLACTPCRVTSAIEPSFGYIQCNGRVEQVKLSRVRNLAFGYANPMHITQAERESFVAHVFESATR